MLGDLRHAVRLLLKAKGWTTVVLLSLALGIGANTALFGVVNGLMLKAVPARDPGSLVRLQWYGTNDALTNHSAFGSTMKAPDGKETSASFSYPMYRRFLAANRTVIDLLACAPFGRVNMIVDGHAEIARAFISSGNYYRMLGVRASAGRLLEPEDDRPEAEPAAVISHRYWQSRFGGDHRAIGKAVRINNVVVTLVGVVSPDFTGIQEATAEAPDVSVPLALHDRLNSGPPLLSDSTNWWLGIVGRLNPGSTTDQVHANFASVFQQTAQSDLERHLASLSEQVRSSSAYANRGSIPDLLIRPAAKGIYDVSSSELRSATMLSAVVGLALLIVCANVANLLLSRASARRREISIRLAMGATRVRLVRQMLTESLLIAAIGGAMGVVVAYWSQRLLPDTFGNPTSLDGHVLGFAVAIATMTGLAFGLVPALTATDVRLNTALKEQGRGVIGARQWFGKSLLVLQVALALVLLVGSALFLRTILNLRSVDVGFNANNLLMFTVNPQLNRYDEPRVKTFYAEMLANLRSVPNVRAAALSQPALLSGSTSVGGMFFRGRTYVRGQSSPDRMNRVVVSPGFFDTLEMPIVKGRGLTERDAGAAPLVAVINEAAARAFFPGANPIGRRFGPTFEDQSRWEIVGVVRDVKYNSLRDAAPPTWYPPYTQRPATGVTFEIRTAGDPASAVGAVRELVRRLDPNLPLTNVTTQLEQIEDRYQQERVFAQAYTLFGALAVILASIGLFGLMSYAVSRRTNEIGIRMALGAQRSSVLSLVLGESMMLVLIGIGLGVATALAAGRFVQAYLFGVPPADPFSIGSAIGVMLAVSTLAAYLPARRASRVSPLVALRTE